VPLRGGEITEPIQRDGVWWQQRDDGTWLRWDVLRGAWVQDAGTPGAPPAPGTSPEAPVDLQAPPPDVQFDAVGAFEPVADKARWAVGSLGVATAVAGISVLTDIALYADVADGVQDTSSAQGFVGLIQLLSQLATAVFFLIWFHTAYENLPRLGARGLRFKTGWTVGAWFVPILNLIRPKAIANDIWRASEPDAPADQGETWKGRSKVATVIDGWWAVWVLSLVGAFGVYETDPSVEQLRSAVLRITIGDALTVVAGVLAIGMVREITARQEERARRLGEAGIIHL
jgi:hypothetical protein